MDPHADIMAYVVNKGLQSETKEDIAIMLSLKQSEKPFFAGKRGNIADEHPAANILHQESRNKTKGMNMYLNYPPSEIELGMMWRAKVEHVFYVTPEEPNRVQSYKITTDGCHYEACEEVTSDYVERTQQLTDLSPDDSIDYLTQNTERADVVSQLEEVTQAPITQRDMPEDIKEILRQGLTHDNWQNDDRDQRPIDEDYIRIVMELVNKSWNNEDNFQKIMGRVIDGNNIGAIMVSEDNQIIGWGLNYKGENKTFHAETMMIQRYLRENNTDRLPDNARIYTSLQCCHMCAGHIAELGKNIKVTFAQEDPYFEGENALTRNLHECSEQLTTLKYGEVFATAVGDQNILDFLFDKIPQEQNDENSTSSKSTKSTTSSTSSHGITRKIFARAGLDVELKQQLLARITGRHDQALSATLQNGREFIQSLDNFYEMSSQASSHHSRSNTPPASPPNLQPERKEPPLEISLDDDFDDDISELSMNSASPQSSTLSSTARLVSLLPGSGAFSPPAITKDKKSPDKHLEPPEPDKQSSAIDDEEEQKPSPSSR